MNSKYETHVQPRLETIRAWKRNGSTDKEIVATLDISESTFYELKRKHPEFSEYLKEGAADAIAIVENAHFRMATGYYVDCSIANKGEREMAKNVELSVSGNTLTIKIDLSKTFGKSKSGKTTIVATTEGNMAVPENPEIRLGVNVYK